jgi:hypothetical protein
VNRIGQLAIFAVLLIVALLIIWQVFSRRRGSRLLLRARLLRIRSRALRLFWQLRMGEEAIIATLRAEPKFSELFMAYLLTRNSRVEEDLID